MLKKNFYTTFFLFSAFFSFGQNSPNPIFTQITEENGLSDNHVNCVLKDRQGMVWIGTENGLNVMNGSSIKAFKHRAGDSTSISNNFINAIKEDLQGNIWIATALGLNCYSKKLGHFLNFSLVTSPYSTSAIISALEIDGLIIWCATDGGLFRFKIIDGSSVYFECGKTEPLATKKFCNKINYLLLDENKICWLCTWSGVWSFDTKNNVFKKQISAANDPLYNPLFLTALNDNNGKIWIGAWEYGLKLFDKKTGVVTNYPNHPANLAAVNSIAKIIQHDGNAVLWLNGNLHAFNPATQTFFQYKKPLLLPEYPAVRSNYTSADNWIWICTDKGLLIYNPQRQIFNTEIFNGIITSQDVILNAIKNNILAGGEGDHILTEYDSTLKPVNEFGTLLFKNNLAKKHSSAMLSIVKESNSKWWMSTSEGIVNIDLKTKRVRWFDHRMGDSTSLPRNFINYLFFDSENKLWIFPWREGIWQMDTSSGKCTRMLDGLSVIAGVKKKLVIADAIQDEQGNIWMCDLDEGIILYERKSNSFSKPFINQVGGGVRCSRIFKQEGYFYTVANTSLVKWKDKLSCRIINFPSEFENQVYDFTPDQQGNWWFATKNGLVYFNEQKHIFKRFAKADGLYSNDLNANLYCMPDGRIIIGARLFLSSFYPKKIMENVQAVPQILLTGFTANGNNVTFKEDQTVDFSYNTNNIVFEWALPDYTNPFGNQYYYRLQGIDSGWRSLGAKGELQYANLSPGNYSILLGAANANGDFAEKEISIHFVIHPPFWKTLWFLLTCVLMAATFTYWLFKRRIRSIKTKATLQQQMTELETKALRAQMNPHFIFNSLNSIQECIVSKNTDAAYSYLSQFSKLVRRILENSGKETVTLQEEQELMQWYLSLEQLRFTDEFTFSVKNNCANPQTEIPSMIIQPFIENAIWHGLANKRGKKMVSLVFNDDEKGINIEIADNGIGRKAAALLPKRNDKQSMGLAITKARLQHYSQASAIEIIDLLDEHAKAGGTKVILHLPHN